MDEPSEFDPVADARTWSRYMARASIVSPFAAMMLIALARQLERRQSPQVVVWIENLSNGASATVAVLGFILGVMALIGGWRRRSFDTALIAGLGLLVSGLYLVLTVFANVLLSRTL